MAYIEQHITSVKCSQHSIDIHTRTHAHELYYIMHAISIHSVRISKRKRSVFRHGILWISIYKYLQSLNSVHIPKNGIDVITVSAKKEKDFFVFIVIAPIINQTEVSKW